MKKISKLAQLFAKYKTYPKSCYNERSPLRAFQSVFPKNHYSKDLETFLSYQDYKPTQRGADLPWWGEKLFSQERGFRTLIVSQDSGYKDAGSIVLAAQFFPDTTREKYEEFIEKMGVERYFSFNRWRKVKDQFVEWELDFPFLYLTDASKVYEEGSWKNRNFDKQKSKELIEAEIELCNPDLIILLGRQPLHLLDQNKDYSSVVEDGKPILIKGKKCIVAPFFIGNGPVGNRGGKGFKKRLEIATNLIKKHK